MRVASEQGSVAILALGLAALAIVFALLTVDLTVFLAGRAQAQLAADAAALAAAPLTFSGGDAADAAATTAAANGAQLTRCDCSADSSWRRREVVATVEIQLDLAILRHATVGATARAVFEPIRLRG